jgi:hypothetical protein
MSIDRERRTQATQAGPTPTMVIGYRQRSAHHTFLPPTETASHTCLSAIRRYGDMEIRRFEDLKNGCFAFLHCFFFYFFDYYEDYMQASTNHVYTRLDISTSLSTAAAAAALPPLNTLFSAWQKTIDYTY